MVVQDLWMKKGPGGKKVPSARHGRGQRWRVVVEDPTTGKTVTEACDTEKTAKARDAILQASILQGTYVDPKAGRVTVQEYAEQWLAGRIFDPQTWERVEGTLRLHVYPILGHLPIAAVLPSRVQGWVADRSRVLAASSLTVAYNTVVAPMFKAAVNDGKRGTTPCVGIDLPTAVGRTYLIISTEQLHELAAALPEEYRAAPWLAAGCGMRGGEIMGTEPDQVRFLSREIAIRQQLKKVARRSPYLALPKSKHARLGDLPEQVAHAVAAQIKARAPVEWEIDDETDPAKFRLDRTTGKRVPPRRVAKLLFATATGRPMTRPDWSGVWKPAVEKAGLPEGFRMHDLRHLFATSLIHHGASVKTVQLALDHASAQTTFDTYIHEWPDLLDRTRTIMERVLKVESTEDEAVDSTPS